jgi:CRISPR/Cas system CSM-associated protein Csm3 (group 7 of RAMP superfamily)
LLFLTPSFKRSFENPINKNNQCKEQIETTNAITKNSKLKRKVHIKNKPNKIKALCLGLGFAP